METCSSRRRTILVFHDRGPGQGVERLSVGRFDYDGLTATQRDTLFATLSKHED